jgi:hypothetical protein
MLFVAAEGNSTGLTELAKLTLARVIRPMPVVRSARPAMRGSPISVGFHLPSAQPLSSEPTVGILDGGLTDQHVLGPFVTRYEKSDAKADDVEDYLGHGLGVTSALLFGPIEPGTDAARPFIRLNIVRRANVFRGSRCAIRLQRNHV